MAANLVDRNVVANNLAIDVLFPELFEDDAFPDGIPDMRPVFETATGNSIKSSVHKAMESGERGVCINTASEGKNNVIG